MYRAVGKDGRKENENYEDDVVVRGVLYSIIVLYDFNGEWLTYRGNNTEISLYLWSPMIAECTEP